MKLKTDHELDSLWPLVVEGIEFLAIQSKVNFDEVVIFLQNLIINNKHVKNIEFLNSSIERIKDKFFDRIQPSSKK